MTALQHTFKDLYEEVAWYLYANRTQTGDALARCKRIVNRGYLHVMGEKDWSFLSPQAYLTLSAPQTTITAITAANPGKVTAASHGLVTGDTVTITGVVGMTEVNGGTFTVTYVNANDFTIGISTVGYTAYDSAGTVTGPARTLLPADFGELEDGFTYAPGAILNTIQMTSPEHIRQMRQDGALVSADPCWYAIEPLAFVTATGQRHQVLWYPTPSTARTVYYKYRVQVAAMSGDTDYPQGGPDHALTILQAALWYAEMDNGAPEGPMGQKYNAVDLPRSLRIDARYGPRNRGPVTDGRRTARASNYLPSPNINGLP